MVARFFCLRTLALLVILIASSAARAQLPPEVQADIMTRELVQAVEAKDFKKVASVIERMRKITKDLPHDVLFYEAEARVNTGYLELGRKALDEYLTAAGRNGEYYQKALELYARLQERALQMARKFLEANNQAQINQKPYITRQRFAVFENARLKRPDQYEVFSVEVIRKHALFSNLDANPCHPQINDQVSVSVGVQPKGTTVQNKLVTKANALVWNNSTSIDLRHITRVRSVDMFRSKNGVTNFVMLDYPTDFLPDKYSFNDDRFVGFSGGGESQVSAKGILLLIPQVDIHKGFVADLKRVIEFCKIAKGDI